MKLSISIYEKVKEASEGVSALILEPDSPSPLLILLISPAKHQTDDQDRYHGEDFDDIVRHLEEQVDQVKQDDEPPC